VEGNLRQPQILGAIAPMPPRRNAIDQAVLGPPPTAVLAEPCRPKRRLSAEAKRVNVRACIRAVDEWQIMKVTSAFVTAATAAAATASYDFCTL